ADAVYAVSSAADRRRSGLRAYTSQDRVKRVPDFESMFSSLAHHPRYTLKLDPTDPVPTFIDRSWRGHAEHHKEALRQLAGVFPNAQARLKREACQVTGADHWKYFQCPLTPFAQQLPPDEVFALPSADKQPTHCAVGVQTDYRESEAQTDPYRPEYVLRPGTTPSELLQLATLTWGCGLPAGLEEVEMIQRARAKRAWEATIPPPDDFSQLHRRRQMMEELELQEWVFREGKIQKLQEARLAVLKNQLRRRDEAWKEATSQRLNQVYSKLQKDKETRRQKIKNDYARALRKLEAKRKNVRGNLERPGIVRRSTENPWTNSDTFTNRSPGNSEFKSYYLYTYEGLVKLEAHLSASILKPQVKRPKPKVNTIKDAIKSPVSEALKHMGEYKPLAVKSLRFLIKKEKTVPRPVTPRVDEPPERDEERELAVIHLQKLLRGRSIQYKMFKGKENHLDLIQELRTVNALQREEQEHKVKRTHTSTHSCFNIYETPNSLAGVVGAELENLFDTLSKELIHLQEERRIHAFMLLAERDRRMREAEESGRRQAEERKRREDDEIFRQVVKVHQETVDLYLEDIILDTLDHTADQQAREEIHRKVKVVNDIAYAMEESRNSLQSEEIVSELVYSFLIPEVEKMRIRRAVHQRQQRHLQAAQSIIQGTVEHSRNNLGASQSTCVTESASSQVQDEKTSQEE
uniref:Cilia- and flagella-associated protein 91 n=1 Tax=Mola mola TaxID=94237 RepID=A0A3Q3XD69_MOLML